MPRGEGGKPLRDLPAVGTLPAYLVDEHEHCDVFMILDVRSGLHVGFYQDRETAEQGREWKRQDWPHAVLMIVSVPASEPWYAEPNNVRLDERNMTRVYGHPPMSEVEQLNRDAPPGLAFDIEKYRRMQVKLLRFFEKRPAKPPTWRHLKWIAGPDDAAGIAKIHLLNDADTVEVWTTDVSVEFVMCFRYLYENGIVKRPEK
jgi:hypothetical protein